MGRTPPGEAGSPGTEQGRNDYGWPSAASSRPPLAASCQHSLLSHHPPTHFPSQGLAPGEAEQTPPPAVSQLPEEAVGDGGGGGGRGGDRKLSVHKALVSGNQRESDGEPLVGERAGEPTLGPGEGAKAGKPREQAQAPAHRTDRAQDRDLGAGGGG